MQEHKKTKNRIRYVLQNHFKQLEPSLGLIVNLIRISTLPLMKPVRKTVLELAEAVAE